MWSGQNLPCARARRSRAEKALELKVIDLIAPDLPALLQQLNGRVVDGKTLKTADAEVSEIKMSASEHVFQTLWRPEVMFVLMLIAIYGIIGELTMPGAILPGVVGAIALILALYMAAILPVNVTGLALIGLALMLFIFDIYAPTHGILTVGGIISFLIGSLMLFNRADPLFRLSLSYIIPATLMTAAFFVFVIGKGLRAQTLPVKAGEETMLGKTVTALTPIDSRGGRIFIEGENWNAVSDTAHRKRRARAGRRRRRINFESNKTRRNKVMSSLEALPRLIGWIIPLVILAVIILPQMIRILREYERGVIFRLGKLLGAKGPGLIFLIPIVDRMVRMDLRVVTINVEAGSDDARQRARDGRCGGLFPRRRSARRGRESGELSQSDFAHRPDDAAQRARPGAARRSAFAARRQSTRSCRRSSTNKPSRGASKSRPSK